VSLCDHHHHVVHLPGRTAKFDGHTFTVFRPDGTEVTEPLGAFRDAGFGAR